MLRPGRAVNRTAHGRPRCGTSTSPATPAWPCWWKPIASVATSSTTSQWRASTAAGRSRTRPMPDLCPHRRATACTLSADESAVQRQPRGARLGIEPLSDGHDADVPRLRCLKRIDSFSVSYLSFATMISARRRSRRWGTGSRQTKVPEPGCQEHPLVTVHCLSWTRGSPDAQLGSRLSGGELCEASGAWRPVAAVRHSRSPPPKRSLANRGEVAKETQPDRPHPMTCEKGERDGLHANSHPTTGSRDQRAAAATAGYRLQSLWLS